MEPHDHAAASAAQPGPAPRRAGGLMMPMDAAKGTSKGFAFIEYSSVQEAAAAKEQLQAYKLDKNHTLTANMFDDVEKYMRVPDQ
jgi:translation initiation factor 3 subunit B